MNDNYRPPKKWVHSLCIVVTSILDTPPQAYI